MLITKIELSELYTLALGREFPS